MTVTIHKLEEHIGADVQGIDITSPINDKTFEQLRAAILFVFFSSQRRAAEQWRGGHQERCRNQESHVFLQVGCRWLIPRRGW